MKNTIKQKLFETLWNLLSKVKESDFDQDRYEWKANNRQRFKEIGRSWRNVCAKYRKFFYTREEYLLDLNLFDFEVRTTETELILKHQYGAIAPRVEILELVINTREPASEVAIKIINSLKYQIYETD